MTAPLKNTLVLGVGNTILRDDGVGIYVVRRVESLLAEHGDEGIEVAEAELAGFALIDLLDRYRSAIIVDAVKIPGREPGEIQLLDIDSFRATSHLVTGHEIDLPTAVELGRKIGRCLPEVIDIIGIQAADDRSLSEECTPNVQQAIEPAARLALERARKRAR